jgi:predicted HNH restriction endonuclease
MKCILCNKKLTGKQTKYCSIKCKNGKHQLYDWQHERGLKYRKELILEFGGKCSSCGYAKNFSALEFHHINPSEKLFQIDIRSCSNRSKKSCSEEAKKCRLLCSNCHCEIHNPQSEINWVQKDDLNAITTL